jgi:hypothetical protein
MPSRLRAMPQTVRAAHLTPRRVHGTPPAATRAKLRTQLVWQQVAQAVKPPHQAAAALPELHPVA